MPASRTVPRWYSADAWPAAAALLYQRNASIASRGRPPLPSSYIRPSLSMAAVLPASAALYSPRRVSTGWGAGKPPGGDGASTGLGTGCAEEPESTPATGTRPPCTFAGIVGAVFAAG